MLVHCHRNINLLTPRNYLQDFGAFDKGDGSGENWLIDFTTQLRSDLPAGDYIITHARESSLGAFYHHLYLLCTAVAPWFSPSKWGGGGYLAVNEKVGDLIDWYNIQFYNRKLP